MHLVRVQFTSSFGGGLQNLPTRKTFATVVPQVLAIAAKLRAVHPGPGLPPVIRASQLAPCLDVTSIAAAGSAVQVVDEASGRYLGWGLWNPHTHQYRVRVLQAGVARTSTEICEASVREAIRERIEAAVALRRNVLGLPSKDTDVFRLVNREGDHLSGLAIDVLGDDLVIRSSSLWVEVHQEAVKDILRACWPSRGRLLWQREADSLVQDGFKTFYGHLPPADVVEDSSPVVVRECGVNYVVAPGLGKKTGHFADQRENRYRLREIVTTMTAVREKCMPPLRVLDLFCYSGGFAVNAALGGTCVEVVAVDMDATAVREAERNVIQNGVGDRVKVLHANAFNFLQDEAAADRLYDIVVCDPPRASYSGGWSQDEQRKAIGYHRRVTRRCLQVMHKGSILVTCTCSQVMTEARLLLLAVMQAAATEGRSLRLLYRTGCGPDHSLHPAWRPSGHLEVLWLQVT